MTQVKYYGVDTGISISEKHVLRVKEKSLFGIVGLKRNTEWIRDIRISYPNVIGNIRYFGLMAILCFLLVVLVKYHRLLYRSTSKAKVNGCEYTRLLPPPKGSGFPPSKPKGLYL